MIQILQQSCLNYLKHTQMKGFSHFLTILALLTLLYSAQGTPKLIQVNQTLPQMNNITEAQTTKQIILKQGEAFIHHSQSIQPIDYYSQNCYSSMGQLVQQHYASFKSEQDQQDFQHVYSEKYRTIYRFQHESISAYRFSEPSRQLTFIQKLELTNSHCEGQVVLNGDGQYLYHFSCAKIIQIQMKRSLTAVKTVLQLEQRFYGFKVISHSDIFIWASYRQGIKIYAQSSSRNQELQQIQHIQKFQQHIIDLVFYQDRLYLLGLKQNIYVYQRLGSGQFQLKANISLTGICRKCMHRQIVVYKSNVYVYSVQAKQQFITQLQIQYNNDFQKQIQRVYLIRFFKGKNDIKTMMIFNNKLLVAFGRYVNLYEINKDPRAIKRQLNGVSGLHYYEIVKFQRISSNMFVKVLQNLAIIIKLSIRNPTIQCKVTQSSKPKQNSQYVEQISIEQPCRQLQNQKYSDKQFWNICTNRDVIRIKLLDEGGAYHHIFAVVSVSVFCVFIIGILVIWRKGKIEMIGNIVKQIQKLRSSKRIQHIQFVEQKIQVKQSNWGDIHQQEVGSKIGSNDNSRNSQKDAENHKNKEYSQFEDKQQIQNDDGNNIQGTQRNMIVNNHQSQQNRSSIEQ